MQESFLHFIWQFQYFNKEELSTVAGEPLLILHPGFPNHDAGPDFGQSKLQLESLVWHGQTEIHIRASDWYQHHHEDDPAYQHVILHVVWEHDQEIAGPDGVSVPTLELKNRVDPALIDRYQQLIENLYPIPCANLILEAPELTRLTMFERTMMQRLEDKASLVLELLERNQKDWEETTYQLLAKNFGFKVNSEAFLSLSQSLPYKIVAKHQHDLTQLEALLFGQSGLLDFASTEDAYVQSIKKEYKFLSHKYGIQNEKLAPEQWKFLRLRPANFPTIRMAQFAALLHQTPKLFAFLKDISTVPQLITALDIRQSAYWQVHFHFNKISKAKTPSFGHSSLENLIINTLVPLWVAYGKYVDDERYIEKSLLFLRHIAAENNKITRIWREMGVDIKSAFDSQASIELFNAYCKPRKCLSCNIGVSVLKKKEGR